MQSATVLVREAFVRDFANSKALGSYAGLSATPYSSGSVNREQGIGKAGNRRLRTVMIELAWLWQRYQPGSANVRWYRERAGTTGARMRKVMVVALARKLLSTDVRNWTLFDIKNWTPELNGCPEAQAERLVQVVHRRDPRAAQRPPRVWRRGAREVTVGPPGQAPGHTCAGTLGAMAGAFNKPVRRFSRSR